MLNPGFPKISIGEGFYPQAIATANAIDQIERSFHDFHEPLVQSLREVIITSVRTNFNVEGRPAWQELAESTVRKRGTSHPILTNTGALKSESTNEQNWTVTTDDVSLTGLDSAVPYAAYNQAGTSKMPAREFVSLQERDMTEIERVFSEWIDRKIAEGGFR